MVAAGRISGVLAGFLVACATTSSGPPRTSEPLVHFPSSRELEKLVGSGAALAPPIQTLDVDRWQLAGPIPAPNTAYTAASKWDELLMSLAKGRKELELSSALACAARETARFYVELGAYPSDALQRYLVARCGSSLAEIALAVFGGGMPDDVPEDVVQGRLAEKFPTFLKEQLPSGPGAVGLGYARGNGRVVIALFTGRPRARLDAHSPLVSGNQAVLAGELPPHAASSRAFVNQGKTGVGHCEADPSVELPRFRYTCPLLESDAQAPIDVAIRKAGQVLLEPVLRVLVRRTEQDGLLYQSEPLGTPDAKEEVAQFQDDVLAKLNALRQSAGLKALTLEPEQSQTNARFAPRWLAATFSGDQATVEQLELGLLAGWQVQGTIRDAGIYSGYLVNSRSPERWLRDALASPLGRSVLLAPEAARIAVGPGSLGTSGVYGLVTTYALFAPGDPNPEDAVFAELSRVREARGFPAPRRKPRPWALDQALESIAKRGETAEAALQVALKELKGQRTLTGWAFETIDLHQLKWPTRLLEPGLLEMSVGVTHHRVPGTAWGQYAVLVIVHDVAEMTRKPGIQEIRMSPEKG